MRLSSSTGEHIQVLVCVTTNIRQFTIDTGLFVPFGPPQIRKESFAYQHAFLLDQLRKKEQTQIHWTPSISLTLKNSNRIHSGGQKPTRNKHKRHKSEDAQTETLPRIPPQTLLPLPTTQRRPRALPNRRRQRGRHAPGSQTWCLALCLPRHLLEARERRRHRRGFGGWQGRVSVWRDVEEQACGG